MGVQAAASTLNVASGILPDVEGRHPCRPETRADEERAWDFPTRTAISRLFPPGWEARLYGRQDACRYVRLSFFPASVMFATCQDSPFGGFGGWQPHSR